MNRLYSETGTELTPLTMAAAANAVYGKPVFSPADYEGAGSRISSPNMCNCNGNGQFKLLPVDHPDVRDGKKRYMQCMICGCWSHL